MAVKGPVVNKRNATLTIKAITYKQQIHLRLTTEDSQTVCNVGEGHLKRRCTSAHLYGMVPERFYIMSRDILKQYLLKLHYLVFFYHANSSPLGFYFILKVNWTDIKPTFRTYLIYFFIALRYIQLNL